MFDTEQAIRGANKQPKKNLSIYITRIVYLL